MKTTGHILLVDDDPDLLELISLTLRKSGHTVTAASRWAEVVESLNQGARGDQNFDLIFLDLMMPERTGFDVLRALKVILFPMPPIVILTALNDIEHAVKALELGAAKYLTKPVSKEKLLSTVREVLEGTNTSKF